MRLSSVSEHYFETQLLKERRKLANEIFLHVWNSLYGQKYVDTRLWISFPQLGLSALIAVYENPNVTTCSDIIANGVPPNSVTTACGTVHCPWFPRGTCPAYMKIWPEPCQAALELIGTQTWESGLVTQILLMMTLCSQNQLENLPRRVKAVIKDTDGYCFIDDIV